MKTILAPRASTILHDLLLSLRQPRPFLLPANVCPIVPITFFKARVPFEFVDIDPQTLAMDLDQVAARLRGKESDYGGLLYAHPYGASSTPEDFLAYLKGRWPHLILIDDRCLCIPELEPNTSSHADVALYSTGYAKIVDIGYGGFAFVGEGIVCEHHVRPFTPPDLIALEAEYKDCVDAHRQYAYHDSDWLETDSRLPDWQEYDERVRSGTGSSIAHRQSLNAVYNAIIPQELCFPQEFQLWRFNLRVDRKIAILEAIFGAGLFASSHYASLVGIMGAGHGGNAQHLWGHVINLFNDHHYSLDMAERTAQIVRGSL